jgi:hypothetical protein
VIDSEVELQYILVVGFIFTINKPKLTLSPTPGKYTYIHTSAIIYNWLSEVEFGD